MSTNLPRLALDVAPWLQRKDWAENRIACSSKTGLWFAWIFTTIWSLLSLPPLYVLPDELAKENYAALIGLIFPAVGLSLIWWAITATRDWLRFGAVFLSLDPLPGVIGGQVAGMLTLPMRYSPDTRLLVTLSCHFGGGKNRRVQEKLLWQAQSTATTTPSGNDSKVRFAFTVPAELPASEVGKKLPCHRWRLEMKGVAPSLNFWREFTIPVYPTAARTSPE